MVTGCLRHCNPFGFKFLRKPSALQLVGKKAESHVPHWRPPSPEMLRFKLFCLLVRHANCFALKSVPGNAVGAYKLSDAGLLNKRWNKELRLAIGCCIRQRIVAT
jgi:hypothetical protein